MPGMIPHNLVQATFWSQNQSLQQQNHADVSFLYGLVIGLANYRCQNIDTPIGKLGLTT